MIVPILLQHGAFVRAFSPRLSSSPLDLGRLARSSSSSSSSSRRELDVWLAASARVPLETVLPAAGGLGQEQRMAAYLGDKILLASFGRWVYRRRMQEPMVRNPKVATDLVSVVLSNKFLGERLKDILPDPSFQRWIEERNANAHTMGTIVEAMVNKVDELEPDVAVDNLVEWLVSQAKETGVGTLVSAKQTLREFGGNVDCERVGGEDHAPVFLAKASLNGINKESTGKTKRIAQHEAALLCLDAAGVDLDENFRSAREDFRAELEPPPTETWTKFTLGATWHRTQKDGESAEDWWRRGANMPKTAFHRCVFSQLIFPDTVITADSWTHRHEESESHPPAVTSVIVLVYKVKTKDGIECKSWTDTETASSATKARSLVGLRANAEISRLLGYD